MALVICPECQREVSDKSTVCIHCGNALTHDAFEYKCPDCGQTVDTKADVCTYCGCPLTEARVDFKRLLVLLQIEESDRRAFAAMPEFNAIDELDLDELISNAHKYQDSP